VVHRCSPPSGTSSRAGSRERGRARVAWPIRQGRSSLCPVRDLPRTRSLTCASRRVLGQLRGWRRPRHRHPLTHGPPADDASAAALLPRAARGHAAITLGEVLHIERDAPEEVIREPGWGSRGPGSGGPSGADLHVVAVQVLDATPLRTCRGWPAPPVRCAMTALGWTARNPGSCEPGVLGAEGQRPIWSTRIDSLRLGELRPVLAGELVDQALVSIKNTRTVFVRGRTRHDSPCRGEGAPARYGVPGEGRG
jgi:hypothetical protein